MQWDGCIGQQVNGSIRVRGGEKKEKKKVYEGSVVHRHTPSGTSAMQREIRFWHIIKLLVLFHSTRVIHQIPFCSSSSEVLIAALKVRVTTSLSCSWSWNPTWWECAASCEWLCLSLAQLWQHHLLLPLETITYKQIFEQLWQKGKKQCAITVKNSYSLSLNTEDCSISDDASDSRRERTQVGGFLQHRDD